MVRGRKMNDAQASGFVGHQGQPSQAAGTGGAEVPEMQEEWLYRGQKLQVSRRQFLSGAATAGVLAATSGLAAGGLAGCTPKAADEGGGSGANYTKADTTGVLTADSLEQKWSFEIAPDPIPESDIKETITHDIIVIGAGLSGLCTAVSAQEAGADVRLFSASSRPIGRGGSNSAIGSKYQKQMGIDFDKDSEECNHIFKVEQVSGAYQQNQKLWAKWRNHSAESMDWMIDIMLAKGLKVSMEPGYWDPDGILSSPPASHNFFTDEQPFGALFGAPLQAQAYADTFIERGGTIDYMTVAKQLIRDDNNTGRVSAVIAQREDGSYVKYVGTKAIVLATGDFSVNRDMMAKYAPWTYNIYKDVIHWDVEQEPNYDIELNFTGLLPGDGHKMGLWVGAAWQKNLVSPMINVGVPGPGWNAIDNCWSINLDETGKRFQRETINFGHGGVGLLNRPNRWAFSVWSQDYANIKDEWESFGVNVGRENGIMPQTPEQMIQGWEGQAAPADPNAPAGPFGGDPNAPKTFFKADSIDDLLKQVNDLHPIDTAAAKQSIADYTRYAKQGLDEEYHVNAQVLHPIENPPFYASCSTFATGSSTFLTVCGGLRTNENMQVCADDDSPIPGLYNTGIMTGDFYATTYNFVFFGQNLGGVCCTLSYLLGRDLAKL